MAPVFAVDLGVLLISNAAALILDGGGARPLAFGQATGGKEPYPRGGPADGAVGAHLRPRSKGSVGENRRSSKVYKRLCNGGNLREVGQKVLTVRPQRAKKPYLDASAVAR